MAAFAVAPIVLGWVGFRHARKGDRPRTEVVVETLAFAGAAYVVLGVLLALVSALTLGI